MWINIEFLEIVFLNEENYLEKELSLFIKVLRMYSMRMYYEVWNSNNTMYDCTEILTYVANHFSTIIYITFLKIFYH